MQHVNNILLYYVDYYPITLSPYDPITLLLYYSITLLLHYSMTLLFYESVKSIYCGDYCSMRNIYSNVYIILWRLLLYEEYIL